MDCTVIDHSSRPICAREIAQFYSIDFNSGGVTSERKFYNMECLTRLKGCLCVSHYPVLSSRCLALSTVLTLLPPVSTLVT